MKIPFRLKLVLLFSAVILIGISISTGFDYRRQRKLIEEGYWRQAETIGATMTPLFLEPLLRGYVSDPENYRNSLAKVLVANEDLVNIQILRDDGRPLMADLPGQVSREHAGRLFKLARPISLQYAGGRFRPIGRMELQFHSERLDRALETEIRRSIHSGLILLVIGIAAALTISHRVTVPLRRLAIGMTRLRGGNLSISVPVTSHDEVGELSAAFNEMVEGLRVKKELLHYVSRSAWDAAHLRATGAAETSGEFHTVTILFSDIKDFTPLTERTPAPSVVAMLNHYFDAMVKIVMRNGGTVDKFIGDAVMALFEGEDGGAAAAMAVAVQMQKEVAALRLKGTSQFHIRVGLNTGQVIMGDIGSIESRRDYTCIGDPVNVASRLCYTCPTDGVHAGVETYKRLAHPPEAERHVGLRVKGIERDLETYIIRV